MAWQLLQPCINLGLDEDKFWDMTIAEIDRWIKGATWRLRTRAQFDYVLSELIGISAARMIDSKVTMPEIENVYPNLFDKKVAPNKNDLMTQKSVNNFMARAMAINKAKRQAAKDNGGERNT